jgi:N-acetyl-anhydromuramyl-L-alanine amidase AmpD
MDKRVVLYSTVAVGIAYFLSKRYSFKPIDIVNDLPRSSTSTYPTRTLNQIDTIIVHHSAVPSTATGATPEGYARFHITSPNYGYPAIAYHVVIQPDGKAYLTNYLETISYHVGALNTSAVGVVLTGNFDNENITNVQKNTLINVLKWIQRKVGRKLKIHGHYRYANKTCPGMNVRADLNEIVTRSGGLL